MRRLRFNAIVCDWRERAYPMFECTDVGMHRKGGFHENYSAFDTDADFGRLQRARSGQRGHSEGMKQYFFGFLVKGETWSQTPPKEELDQLMKKHLAYIHAQVDAGAYKLVGPFLDDDRIRGFLVINAATEEDAQRIVSGDPLVKVGRMAVEIHPAMFADISCVRMEYEDPKR
jgi:uncharacterized protein YciI